MGTGKTAEELAEWGDLATGGEQQDLLVAAPAGSYRNWWETRPSEPSQLDVHLAPELRERVAVMAWVSGAGKQHLAKLARFLEIRDRPRALFVNVEALGVVERARELVLQYLAARRCRWLIDESTRVRTPDALRTDWIVRAGALARARVIMSGLPAPRSPLDLFSQFEFLDWRILGHRSFFTFRARYARMEQRVTGVTFTKAGKRVLRKAWVVGRDKDDREEYRNLPELRERIAPWHHRVLAEDVLGLPPMLPPQRREVELTDEQRRVYEELRTQATAELDSGEHVNAERRVTQVLRLHQVTCGHVTTEGGSVRELKSNRPRELLELLEEFSGKAAIWFCYEAGLLASAEMLRREFGPQSVACYWGGNRATRGEEESRWKSDGACRFMLATQASGGVGNNWQVGRLGVYFSNSWDLEHRDQSERRLWRQGQTGTVGMVDLVAPSTVDERILEVLRYRRELGGELMSDERYREWLEKPE
jgi:hypothetical protein